MSAERHEGDAADPRRLPDDVHLGGLALAVADLGRAVAFYEGTLGLEVVSRSLAGPGGPDEPHAVELGAGGRAFLRLEHLPDPLHTATGAPPPARGARLYHLAILYPSRADLARATLRLLGARWPIQGASDHLVSEAIYLADPEGNGIEIYRDRPRADWPRDGRAVRMATLPLDVPALLADADVGVGAPAPAPPGTTLGHVHLHVGDVLAAETFYRDVVGLDLTARYGDQASFLSAGGYHHHVAVNSWGTAGAPSARPGALGLRWYAVVVPGEAARAALAARLEDAGVEYHVAAGGLDFHDPSGHRVVVRAG